MDYEKEYKDKHELRSTYINQEMKKVYSYKKISANEKDYNTITDIKDQFREHDPSFSYLELMNIYANIPFKDLTKYHVEILKGKYDLII